MKIAHYVVSGIMLAVLVWLAIAEISRINAVKKIEKDVAEATTSPVVEG